MASQIFPRGPRVEIAGVLVPLLINENELDAAVRRYAPPARGLSGRSAVLVSVAIDADGCVLSAETVAPPREPWAGAVGGHALTGLRRGLSFGDGPGAAPAPELARAAEQAARSARFLPAERAGAPVPFPDYRLTIVFDHSAPERSGLARPRL